MLIVRPFSIHFVAVLDHGSGVPNVYLGDLHDYPGMGPSILAKAATPARLPGEPGGPFPFIILSCSFGQFPYGRPFVDFFQAD